MPELVSPTTDLYAAWRDAHRDWGPGLHEDGFGLRPEDEVETPEGFAAWVRRLGEQPSCRYRWVVEEGRVQGGIALRWGESDFIGWAGHIGYGIRPAARRRGLGAWALAHLLPEAKALGLTRLTLVCLPGNVASIRTIERCGGVFERIDDSRGGPLRRYVIVL